MAKLALLRMAKKEREAQENRNRKHQKAEENKKLAEAAQTDSLDPATIYKILSERHLAEMKQLEQNFFNDKERVLKLRIRAYPLKFRKLKISSIENKNRNIEHFDFFCRKSQKIR